MPVYTYKALSSSGVEVRGQLSSRSLEDLRAQLLARELVLQRANKVISWPVPRLSPNRVSRQDFYLFNREFLALLRAGLAIPAALKILSDRPQQPVLQHTLASVLQRVEQGSALSAACAEYPNVFDSMYISSLMIGESSGDLVPVLKRYQDFLRLKISLTKKVQQALAYPVFLLITMAVIVLVLFSFVLPRFAAMYTSFDAALPLPTQLLINLVDYAPVYIPIALAIFTMLLVTYKLKLTQGAGSILRDRWVLKLPIVGKIIRLHAASQVSRTLSTLLSSRLPLIEAFNITAQSLANRYYAQCLQQVNTQLESGERLSDSIDKIKLFPDTSIKMIQAAELSGDLQDMLAEVAQYHEETLEYALTRLMAYIEPLIILLMGLFVGAIILVMYLPIFSVADVIR